MQNKLLELERLYNELVAQTEHRRELEKNITELKEHFISNQHNLTHAQLDELEFNLIELINEYDKIEKKLEAISKQVLFLKSKK